MAKKARRIGRDRVELSGDSLTVISPVQHMNGWDVRRYRASVIRFDGRAWRVTKKTTGLDKLTRYDLVPWEPSDEELTGPEIDYSTESVALRDHAIEIGHKRGRVALILNLVRPLTGFLPARTKDRLETMYGIDPVASTNASVFIQLSVTLAFLALASIAQMVKVYGFESGISIRLALLVAVVAAVDAAVRWSQLFGEVRPAPGFYEWVLRRSTGP